MTRQLSAGSVSANAILLNARAAPGAAPGAEMAAEMAAPAGKPVRWRLAEETPIGIMIASQPVAVMMATPADFEDFATGFLLSEGYVAGRSAFKSMLVLPTETGFCLDVALNDAPLREPVARTLEGRSGCGLCGMRELTDVSSALPHRHRTPLRAKAVSAAFAALAGQQPLRAENFSVHGAGFATHEGRLVLVREDVGRHNALDKLIGALARKSINPASGFAVMSSRCSFELVQKAARAGLGGLATLSAPTALACRLAKQAGLPLYVRDRQGVVRF